MLQWILIFIVSLAVLLTAAKYFTETAEKLGLYFGISPFVVGVVIVSIGTTLPELATSLSAVLSGHSEIVIGNVVGSNITNILLVLATAAIVGRYLKVSKDILNIDLPILIGSVLFMFITTLDGVFTYIDGIICIAALVIYMTYNICANRTISRHEKLERLKKQHRKEKKTNGLALKYPLIMIIAAAVLYFSASFTVKAVVEIATALHVGAEIIALTAVAIGTSLPEMSVAIFAALRGKPDIALGNITGANIMNSLGGMGIPSLFGTLYIPQELITFTIPFMILVTVLYVFSVMDRRVTHWEGITLLLLFVAFLGKTLGVV